MEPPSCCLYPPTRWTLVTLDPAMGWCHLDFVIQLLSRVQLFATPWAAAHQASLSFPISRSLLKLMSFESVMPSDHLILCYPLLFLPSFFPSIRVFSNELALHLRWPKYWSFSISPSNEYSGLISFTMDWFDLLAVQGTLKSLLQHHSLKVTWIGLLFYDSPAGWLCQMEAKFETVLRSRNPGAKSLVSASMVSWQFGEKC